MRVRDVPVATTVRGEPGTDRLYLSGGWRSHGAASSDGEVTAISRAPAIYKQLE